MLLFFFAVASVCSAIVVILKIKFVALIVYESKLSQQIKVLISVLLAIGVASGDDGLPSVALHSLARIEKVQLLYYLINIIICKVN